MAPGNAADVPDTPPPSTEVRGGYPPDGSNGDSVKNAA